jgi:4-diphosphocytidyl-2-C-methyl-D-erythritol kinase
MAAIAAPLGADMAMCLAASPLTAKGIGDELTFVKGMPQYAMVLVNPGIPVDTAAVFKGLARADNMPLPALPKRLDLDHLVAWLLTTRNDLQAPAIAICPAIAECVSALDWEGAAFARMSGSGATCFGLFQTGNAAKRAALSIRKQRPDWFVAATRTLDAQDAAA